MAKAGSERMRGDSPVQTSESHDSPARFKCQHGFGATRSTRVSKNHFVLFVPFVAKLKGSVTLHSARRYGCTHKINLCLGSS